MNTTKNSIMSRTALYPARTANCQLGKTRPERTVKKAILISLVLMVAGIADAQNIPSGLTGLWRFQDTSNPSAGSLGAATVGSDIMFSNAVYGTWFLGPSEIDIGGDGWLTRYSDNYVFQESSLNYMAVNPNFTANGGGGSVNQYTIAIDYVQTTDTSDHYNSLFQTAWGGHDNDGDLFIVGGGVDGSDRTLSTIGIGDVGYSTLTFDSTKWHRIVWSVDNGDTSGAGGFFRVYIDGALFLDGAGQGKDGRFALFPNRFNLFADDDAYGVWEDAWGLVGTVAAWNRALTSDEVAGMGGWIGGAAAPTPLVYSNTPEIVWTSPADGETNVSPNFAYQAFIFDPVQLVDRNSFQLLLDGVPVTPVVTGPVASVFIKFSGGGLLQGGSTHKYTLTGAASGVSFTNEATFEVQNYTSYEWRFTNGDLSAALGNGVMDYADSTTPGLTSFGTTDGSTVPNINGSPAKYMHVPAFTDDLNGYFLYFDDSGPNVGTSASINRYTLMFDILIPSPWPNPYAYIVPFFNTDPYNLDDADFYLYSDGELGIGAGGYSGTNTVTSNTWYRIAFVADLANNTLTYYVNGSNVWSRAADGLGGRWSLYSSEDPGPDLLLFNEPTGTSTHELYVSSVAFMDRALSAPEIAALGGPSADGILVSSFTPKPTLKSQRSGNGAVISWPTNYVGYALESKTSLTGSTWVPVPGVTNNSVNIPAGAGSQFFRLVQ